MRGKKETLLKGMGYAKNDIRLHIAKLVVEPRLVGIVDYIFIQQNTGKLAEEIFKVSEMVYFDSFKLGVEFAAQTVDFFCQTGVKPVYLFTQVAHFLLLKSVFKKVDAVPEEAYGKDYSCCQKKQHRRYRGEVFHYFIQNIPAGHFYSCPNISIGRRIGQEFIFTYFSGLRAGLPKILKSANNHRRETACYSGNSRACISGLGKVYTGQQTTEAKNERKHLANYRDKDIGQGNSFFRYNIGGIMGFSHAHDAFREIRPGIFVINQHFGIGQRALKICADFLGMDNLLSVFAGKLALVCHEFPSRAFACFFAGYLSAHLRHGAGNLRLGGMNLQYLSKRYDAADNLNKGKEPDRAARLKLCLLQNHSYSKYPLFWETFQAFFAGSGATSKISEGWQSSALQSLSIISRLTGSFLVNLASVFVVIFANFNKSVFFKPFFINKIINGSYDIPILTLFYIICFLFEKVNIFFIKHLTYLKISIYI
jgi:hypothetical protein